MLQNYLSNRTERTKNNDAHRNGNSNDTYLFAVPQGFLLGPVLFVIASYADNITICASSSSLDAVISKLNKQEENTNNLFQWFRNYHTKDNADKRHLNHTKAKTDKLNLLVTDHPPVTDNYEVSADINEFEIEDSKKEKLLGISIDARLSFEHHIKSFCTSQKLNALQRITHALSNNLRKRSLMKPSVISQFNYCSLIWMFHNSTLQQN